MLLPGRLDATTLGDLLGTLYRGSATGVLELQEIAASGGATRHGRTHRIQLLSGLVAGVETELSNTPIGEMLVRMGKIDRRAVEVMLYRMALGDPRPAGAILVSMGAVTTDTLIAGLRAQQKARLDAIYRGLNDARVVFRTSRPLPKETLRVGTMLPRDFLQGRPRKRDLTNRPPRNSQPKTASRTPWWATREWGIPETGNDTPPPPSGSRPKEPRTNSNAPADGPRGKALRALGLSLDADEATIRRAFKKLAIELHPDRYATSPTEVRDQYAARFAEASAAYHLLVA
ncbi:MAG: DnaJ domain-containing protein [Polyangiaceae bacterium]|nr:DnaJ domain-containing protein [Polyangiaceae bacterium]